MADVFPSSSPQESKTPILDLITPLPEFKNGRLSPRYAIVVVSLMAASLIFANLPLVAIILGYITINLVATSVHEAGHLIAGWSVRLQLEYLMVGPLCVQRLSGRWKLQLHWQVSVGGLIQMSIDRVCRVRRRLFVYYLGGPAVSLLTGLVALFSCRIEQIGGNPALGLPLAGYAILSLLIAIQSLRPLRFASYASDGLLLRTLWRSYEGARQQVAAHALQILKKRNIDRSLWNRRWMKLAATPSQILRTTYFEDWLSYERAPNSEAAAVCLERCLDGLRTLSPLDREEVIDDLFLEAAAFTAWKTGDAKKAAVWIQRTVHPDRARVLTRAKAEAALHCANGRFDVALAEWEKGFDFIRRLPTGDRTSRTALQWFQLKEALEERRREHTTPKEQHSLSTRTLILDFLPCI